MDEQALMKSAVRSLAVQQKPDPDWGTPNLLINRDDGHAMWINPVSGLVTSNAPSNQTYTVSYNTLAQSIS